MPAGPTYSTRRCGPYTQLRRGAQTRPPTHRAEIAVGWLLSGQLVEVASDLGCLRYAEVVEQAGSLSSVPGSGRWVVADEVGVAEAGIDAYIGARRWDRACLSDGLLVQAQTVVLDGVAGVPSRSVPRNAVDLGLARHDDIPVPSRRNAIMLWVGPGQCDWWISGTDVDWLADAITALLQYFDLRSSVWSHDVAGQVLLDRIRRRP